MQFLSPIIPLFITLCSTTLVEAKPLKVFILAGQSNMQGHAKISTISHLGKDPKTIALLSQIQKIDGSPQVFTDVKISAITKSGIKTGSLTTGFGADSEKIGPELTFGATLYQHLKEPILIIKTSWGGKSLSVDFRPPSAGLYKVTPDIAAQIRKRGRDVEVIEKAKQKASHIYYKMMIEHIHTVLKKLPSTHPAYNPKEGYTISGFVWFQGWNDFVDHFTYPKKEYTLYSKLMEQLINDVRKDLKTPKLPFVIGVLGVNGPVDHFPKHLASKKNTYTNFRNAMAAPTKLPEFTGNTAAVFTEKYWDLEISKLCLRKREVKIQHKKITKDQNLNPQQTKAAFQKLMKQEFSEKELRTLALATSNADYHYHGAAKIMAKIGKGFADAMLDIQPTSKK